MTVECVLMSTYRIRKTEPSELGIGQEIERDAGFSCPRCGFQNPELEHGDAAQCPNCEMHFRLYGNGLYCSDAFIPEHKPGRDVVALRKLVEPSPLERAWRWLRGAGGE